MYDVSVTQLEKAERVRGRAHSLVLKLLSGGLLFTVLSVVIWLPLLFYSSGAPTFVASRIETYSANLTLSAGGGVWPLFQGGWLSQVRPGHDLFDEIPAGRSLQCARLASSASSRWGATPPATAALQAALLDDAAPVHVTVAHRFERSAPADFPTCVGLWSAPLAPSARKALAAALAAPCERPGNATACPRVDLSTTKLEGALYPLWWHVKGARCVTDPIVAFPKHAEQRPTPRVACSAQLAAAAAAGEAGLGWWDVRCQIVGAGAEAGDACWAAGEGGPLAKVVLNDVQGGLIGSVLASRGLIYIYAVFVVGVANLVRGLTSNLRYRVQYEELPDPRRLVALCEDIYIARAEGELGLERDLYAALVRIYRLPELLFRMTKKDV